jgi:capsular polysaccharide biosynthesis protein
MTEQIYVNEGAFDEADYDEADIVEWYEASPGSMSNAAITGSIVAAFALGVLTAVGALVLMGRLDD